MAAASDQIQTVGSNNTNRPKRSRDTKPKSESVRLKDWCTDTYIHSEWAGIMESLQMKEDLSCTQTRPLKGTNLLKRLTGLDECNRRLQMQQTNSQTSKKQSLSL